MRRHERWSALARGLFVVGVCLGAGSSARADTYRCGPIGDQASSGISAACSYMGNSAELELTTPGVGNVFREVNITNTTPEGEGDAEIIVWLYAQTEVNQTNREESWLTYAAGTYAHGDSATFSPFTWRDGARGIYHASCFVCVWVP